MLRFFVIAALLAACTKNKPDGTPAAQDWSAAQEGGGPNLAPETNPHGGNNPHAGLGLGPNGEPEAQDDEAEPSNPHAGMDPSNPHAGVDMSGAGGTDVSKLGLPPPDPNRPIDPSRYVKGVITDTGERIKPGSVVYVVVKHVDASGAMTGTALAVDKLTWPAGHSLAFQLGDAQAMVGGTELTGDVIVQAHYAQNGDALSKATGDVIGQMRVKIPAQNVKIVMDKVLP